MMTRALMTPDKIAERLYAGDWMTIIPEIPFKLILTRTLDF
jgi:hypothetical protein